MRYISPAMILLLIFNVSLFGKDTIDDFSKRPGYGLILGYNLNMHSANFSELPTVGNCCPKFESGSGGGMSFGLSYEMAAFDKASFLLRAIYSGNGALLEYDEEKYISLGDELRKAKLNHTIDANISMLLFEPLLSYNLFDNFSLLGGFYAGLLAGKSFEQQEELLEPAGKTFENGLKVRNQVSGDIQNASAFQLGLSFGARYEILLSNDNVLSIAPEMLYTIGLTPLVSFDNPDDSWSASAFRMGAAIIYRPLPDRPIEVKYEKTNSYDTLVIDPSELLVKTVHIGAPYIEMDTLINEYSKTITEITRRTDTLFMPDTAILIGTVRSMGFDGINEYKQVQMQVQEIPKINFTPLLTYVFFDENSSKIPKRYTLLSEDETYSFNIDKFFNIPTITTYYQMLNIVGSRMRYNTEAKITLTGCNSDVNDEDGNKELSKARAMSVKNYLTSIWKINPERIRIKTRNLPKNPSKKDIPDGMAENRRVEISSEEWEITKPVITNDTLREIFAPRIKFYIDVNDPKLLTEWKLTVTHNGRTLKEFFGKNKISETITWRINEEKETIPDAEKPIDYILELTDTKGRKTYSKPGSIGIESYIVKDSARNNSDNELYAATFNRGERITNKKTETFSLILFDFDIRRMNKNNKRIVKFIKSRLKKDSKVTIEGYTDRTGDDEYNLKLSAKRAKAAAGLLKSADVVYNGFGEINPLYDNDLPEGRFYSRTVIIIVESPIEDF